MITIFQNKAMDRMGGDGRSLEKVAGEGVEG